MHDFIFIYYSVHCLLLICYVVSHWVLGEVILFRIEANFSDVLIKDIAGTKNEIDIPDALFVYDSLWGSNRGVSNKWLIFFGNEKGLT